MKTFILALSLLVLPPIVSAEMPQRGVITVAFSIDGTSARCDGFKVTLDLGDESIQPKQRDQGFEVPEIFQVPAKSWNEAQHVDISLTCNGHTLRFPHQHPAFIREGDWRLGIAHPLYAVKEYGYTHEFDRGTWLGYLIFEGEPGVITFSAQSDPLDGSIDALRKEQPSALPDRARDIAYVLAVSNVEYQKNRDYLVSSLNACLSRPKESSENEVCDGDLLKFVTNLYWRGDRGLLAPLLEIAESRRDVIGDIGSFYSDLLVRDGEATLKAMRRLSAAKQQVVCKLADEDDLHVDSAKRERVVAFLLQAKDAAANQCLSGLGSN